MPKSTFDYFVAIIVFQLFFGAGISMLAYSLPSDPQGISYTVLAEPKHEINIKTVGQDLKDSAEQQVNLPLVDLGALVFYSGNIVMDMVLNSVFAVPEVVTLGFDIVMGYFPIDVTLQNYIKIVIFAVIMALYVIGILAFVMNMRSGAPIV